MKIRVLALALLTVVARLSFGCPAMPPGASVVIATGSGCTPDRVCPHGTKVGFLLTGLAAPSGPVQPPGGYTVQPCDELTWDFGDGSPLVTMAGRSSASHTWTTPGNYEVSVTVRNAMGEARFSNRWTVGTPVTTISWAPLNESVAEGAASLVVQLTRSGDLQRRVGAQFRVFPEEGSIDAVVRAAVYDVVFEPGQATQQLTLPMYDNALYDGDHRPVMQLREPEGGVLLAHAEGPLVLEDETRPTISAADVAVLEGDGRTRVTVPVQLTGALGHPMNIFGWLEEVFEEVHGEELAAGRTSGTLWFDIDGDDEPGPDRRLTLRNGPYPIRARFPLFQPTSAVLLINDDPGLLPRSDRGVVGERRTLMLHPGRHFDEPATLRLRSSDPSIAAVAESILVPAATGSIPVEVTLLGEGTATIEAELDGGSVSSEISVRQPRAVTSSGQQLTMVTGATAQLTISLSPALAQPVTVVVTADRGIVDVPRSLLVPAGGTATIDVRALGAGATAIAVTALGEEISGVTIPVDVVVAKKRRSAR